jgi:hypothetical protein
MIVQFHETEYGRRFFGKQLPELIKAIEYAAKALEDVTKALEKQNENKKEK